VKGLLLLDLIVFLVVLFAAFLHAFWNFLLKGNSDKALAMCAVTLGHTPFCVAGIFYSGFPDIQALFYILGGALLHSGYQIALMHAYRFGDLTQIYPIARGLSPLLLILATLIIGQEILSDMQILAIILVAVSLFVFGLSQLRARESGLVSLVMAVTAGIFIASYSFVDAIGARLSQNAVSYYSVMSFLNALIMLVYFAFAHKGVLLRLPSEGRKIFWIGGGASYAAYVMVLWACLSAPVALVSSLRETSVLFAIFFGVFFLGEKLTASRIMATITLVIGVVVIRLF